MNYINLSKEYGGIMQNLRITHNINHHSSGKMEVLTYSKFITLV